MHRFLVMTVALVASISAGHAQPLNPPLKELASLLERHGYGDVRSVEAHDGTLAVMARMQNGSPIRVSVDTRRGTVNEVPAKLLFVRYEAPGDRQMTFRELAALLDETVPGARLVELKRNQGGYEIHLRAEDEKAVGMLVDLTTRKIMPYHSLD